MKKVLLLMLVILFFSCAREAGVPQSPASQPVAAPREATKQGWELEWEKIQQEAKKEGKVVIYTSAGGTLVSAMQKGFKGKYGIDTEFMVGRGEEMTERIKTERRADLYVPDFFIGGSGIPILIIKPQRLLDKLEPMLMLPEVTDAKVWWGGEVPWLDKDRTTLGFSLWVQIPMAFNTTLVKAEDLKSYRELLKPKYKGKIVIDDPSITGSGASIIGVLGSTVTSWDFIRELAQQEPFIQRDARIAMDGLAQGKYMVYIGVKPELIFEFRQAGAAIESAVPDEGNIVTAGSGAIAAFNRRPHENASKLFVNWLLTREGQTIFTRAYSAPSARLDVSTEGLDPLTVLKPGVQYFRTHDEDFVTKRGEYMKIATDIFKQKK